MRSLSCTKKGPGRMPESRRPGRPRRRVVIHGPGSLAEVDRRVTQLLADPVDPAGKKILRMTGSSLRALAELELEIERQNA